jgi:hypothetical protein
MILRDLAVRIRDLDASEQKAARRLLARPTDNPDPDGTTYAVAEETPLCDVDFCVHYVGSTADAPDPTDDDADGTPDYVQETATTLLTVWGQEIVAQGYREPKDDSTSANHGPNGTIDVYIADIGDDGLYGYCTTDDPNIIDPNSTYQFFDGSAYCVVDDDFSPTQFQTGAQGIAALRVTVAHEFFHAVQFAYDLLEDQWFMESTATWMEDEVYDAINDNRQYLSDSPIRRPTRPLDKGATNAEPCCHVYGAWIWFRFLSEWFGSGGVDDRAIVREIWERGDGSAAQAFNDNYSIQAVHNELVQRGQSFRKMFANFGRLNRVAKQFYSEGSAYPNAPLSATAMRLTPGSPSRTKSATMAHQTQRYFEFTRGRGVRATAKLRLTLDLPNLSTGAAASVIVFRTTGAQQHFTLGLTSAGNGTFNFAFGSSVTKVDVILTNGSVRYASCFVNSTPYACSGAPVDDGRVYKLTGRLA